MSSLSDNDPNGLCPLSCCCEWALSPCVLFEDSGPRLTTKVTKEKRKRNIRGAPVSSLAYRTLAQATLSMP